MPKDTFFNLSGDKQEKIMRSAINEFLCSGFEKGNIGDIAKKAGVAKGSMYQYFENKKELFLYCVKYAIEFITTKYGKYMLINEKGINIFDYFYHSSKELLIQLQEEKELVIFIQDVFLGKYSSLTGESMDYMMKIMDRYVLELIRDGKNNGYIRKDIDDNMLALFLTGASIKIKEYLMNKARDTGEDLINEDFEVNEKEIKAMIDLLKNGMGEK